MPCLCDSGLVSSFLPRVRDATSSALLLPARLLQLRFQLHRKVVARVVVVPALLPQMRGARL